MRPAAKPSASVEQFLKGVVECGFLTTAESRQCAAALPPDADVRRLARELIERHKLTPFQASALLQGKAKSLVFGGCVLLDKLGEGGMGQVFKAWHRNLNRVVALKVMALEKGMKESSLKRFRREVRVVSKLSHPHIIGALDSGEEHGVHYLVMEYVEGCDLAQWVARKGPLSGERAVELILQAARGLAHAHEAGIIHRDIKPNNLFLDSDGSVKVLDLGLARIESTSTAQANDTCAGSLTSTGSLMGTVAYMAPEQALNAKDADVRADIYSLGCTLHFLLTGRPLYRGETTMATVFAHQENPIPPLPGVSPALEAVFRRMVAKDPTQRYQSMPELIGDLETKLRSKSRRALRLWALAGGTVAAAAVVAAVLIGADPSAPANTDSPPPNREAPPQAAVSPAPPPASTPARDKMAQATKPANGGSLAWKPAEAGLGRDEERKAAMKLLEAQEALFREQRYQKVATKHAAEHPKPQGEKGKGPGQ